jgi:hypothetical protein
LRPTEEGENKMAIELITSQEAEVLGEGALESKLAKLMADLMRTNTERAFALASLETVEAELNRKRSQTPRLPAPTFRI